MASRSVIADLIVSISLKDKGFQKGLDNLSKSANKISKSMKSAGSTLTKTVTAPIVGIGAAAIKTAADFESQMSKVQAISGATGSEMVTLANKAKEMGATTKFTATESAKALEYMGMAGWKAADMTAGLPGIINLAAASGEDLALVSDIVTDALTAFGMGAKDSGNFADLLAKTVTNCNTNVNMLGESFKYAAPVMGAAGYTAEDTALALGLMANAGIKASNSGTALRAGITRLLAPPKAAAAAMDKYGISLTDSSGNMKSFIDVQKTLRDKMKGLSKQEQVAAANALFGKTAMAGWLSVINASDADFKKLTDTTRNYNGTAKKMSDVMLDNLTGQMILLKSAVSALLLELGNALIPYVKKLAGVLQVATAWFTKLTPGTKRIAVIFAIVAAAIGPVIWILGSLVGAIGTLLPIIGALFSPLGAIAAILALVAIKSGLAKKAFGFVKSFAKTLGKELEKTGNIGLAFQRTIEKVVPKEVIENIKSFISKIIEVKNILSSGFSAAAGTANKAIDTVVSTVQKFAGSTTSGKRDMLKDMFGEAKADTLINVFLKIKQAGKGLVVVFQSVWDRWVKAASSFKEYIPEIVESWNRFKESFMKMWEIVGPILGVVLVAAFGIVVGAIQAVIAAVGPLLKVLINLAAFVMDTVALVFGLVKAIWTNDFSEIGEIIGRLKDDVVGIFEGLFSAIYEIVKNLVDGVVGFFTDMYYIVVGGSIIPDMVNEIISWFTNLLSSITGTVKDIFDSVVGVFTDISDSIGKVVKDAWSWGSNMVTNIIGGITDKIGDLKKTVGKVASTIGDYLMPGSPMKKGPGRTLDKWGGNIMGMISKGINEGVPNIRRDLGYVFPTIPDSNARNGGGGNSQRTPQNITLRGTITVRGVSSKGELVGSTNLIANQIANNIGINQDRISVNMSQRRMFQS